MMKVRRIRLARNVARDEKFMPNIFCKARRDDSTGKN
jgi:hypothetical protein